MKLNIKTLTLLEKHGFNQRSMTESDFYSICEIKNINVFEHDCPTSFYFSIENRHFIVIKKSLKGLQKTFSMFHELAHYFLHGGKDFSVAYFYGLSRSKNELEADAFALLALLPKNSLNDFDFLENHPNRYARKLFNDRKNLYFTYGV